MFTKYSTETLTQVQANLERGVENAVDVFAAGGPKSGYAVVSYHLCLDLLAQVEDELYEREQRDGD